MTGRSRRRLAALVCAVGLLVAGCQDSGEPMSYGRTYSEQTMEVEVFRTAYEDGGRTNPVWRFVDEEAGVVCWAINHGLSCLPAADTQLDR